jgi:hypothetical protein
MNIESNAENYIPKDQGEDIMQEDNYDKVKEEDKEKPVNRIIKMIFSQTGEGSISSYNDHPMNFKSDDSISQILRGMTGILGNLNFALIDIFLGSMSFFKNRNNVSVVIEEEEKEKPSYYRAGME